MILNRLKKNFKSRQSFLKQENTNCFRLYDMDIPEYPFIIDVYGENIVIWPKLNPKVDLEPEMKIKSVTEALKTLFNTKENQIIIKERSKQKGTLQYEKVADQSENQVVIENSIKYYINLNDYLDCGLFMDHRPFRKNIKKLKGNGQNFLNLFCYTTSVSIPAAEAGFKTVNVDLSNTYLEWGKKNFILNNIDPNNHQFIKKSTMDFLIEALEEDIKYDIIFLDPPTFSNSKSMDTNFEVEKDHEFLIIRCMKILKKKGILYFSNNKRSFKLAATLSDLYNIKNITEKSIPADFRDKKIHQLYEIRHVDD